MFLCVCLGHSAFAMQEKKDKSVFFEGDFDLSGALTDRTHRAEFEVTWEPSKLMEGPTPHVNSHESDLPCDHSWSQTWYTIRFSVGHVRVKIFRNSDNATLMDYSLPLYMTGSTYGDQHGGYGAEFEALNTGSLDGPASDPSSRMVQSYMTFGTRVRMSWSDLSAHKVISADEIRNINWYRTDVVGDSGNVLGREFYVYDRAGYEYARAHRDDEPRD